MLLFTKLQRALIQRAPCQRDQTELLADPNCVNHRNKLAITHFGLHKKKRFRQILPKKIVCTYHKYFKMQAAVVGDEKMTVRVRRHMSPDDG